MKPTDFSVHVTSFLTHYLAALRNVSPNTIKAYRDVFTLLLRFCRDVQGIAPERLRLEQIDVSLVEAFLDYLERERKSSPHTRNHRLAALHSFFRYVQAEEPAACFSVKKSSPCPSGDTLAPPSPTLLKKSWLRSWCSQTSKRQRVEEMQFC
jgi:site-specific recombinase XerD